MLQHAKKLIAKGLYLFPLRINGGTPILKNFSELCSNDLGKFSLHWKSGNNIAIATEKYKNDKALVVVDIDVKKDKNGVETAKKLRAEGFELAPTLVATTKSGGYHFIYYHDHPVKQGVDVLGRGIDIRSKGGYIVAPGSKIDGGEYKILHDIAIAKCPDWVVERCGLPKKKDDRDKAPVVDVQELPALDRATNYLLNEAP